jgi:thymidylate kinase
MFQFSLKETRSENDEARIATIGNPHASPSSAAHETRFKEPSHVLGAVFNLLDRNRISYCLVHGYEELPESWGSDIDIIIERNVGSEQLVALISQNEKEIGAKIVRVNGSFITLLCRSEHGLPTFLLLDFSHDYQLGPYRLCGAEQILRDHRGHLNFWIPTPSVEFDCLLARTLLKSNLNETSCTKLSKLFADDPLAVERIVAKRWPVAQAATIIAAARTGDWEVVMASVDHFAGALRRNLFRSSPGQAVFETMRVWVARMKRFHRPPGLSVALLGPDGAGKSSTIAALEEGITPLFARSASLGFAPSLRQMLHNKPLHTGTPHALAPRSTSVSLIRAAYWALYGLLGHATIHWAKTRSTLVLYDRHFIDILVDPVRYRYGGPTWALRLIWRIMVKPDLIILLTGPAEILQARKKELSVAETERQSRDYLALIEPLKSSRIVNADQSFEDVVSDVCAVVIDELR